MNLKKIFKIEIELDGGVVLLFGIGLCMALSVLFLWAGGLIMDKGKDEVARKQHLCSLVSEHRGYFDVGKVEVQFYPMKEFFDVGEVKFYRGDCYLIDLSRQKVRLVSDDEFQIIEQKEQADYEDKNAREREKELYKELQNVKDLGNGSMKKQGL